MTSRQTIAASYLILIGLILAWGFNFPTMKLTVESASPLWITTLRTLVAAPILMLYLILLGKACWPTRQDWRIIGVVAIFQTTIYPLLIVMGISYSSDIGRCSILAYTLPFWVPPLAFFFLKERLSGHKLWGLLIGIAGILLLFNPLTHDWHNHDALLSDGLLLAGALAWAIAIVCIRGMRWEHSPLQLLPWQLLFSAVILLSVAMIFEPHPQIQWSPQVFGLLTYIVVVATIFGFWATIELSRRFSANFLSLAYQGVPIIGLISSDLIMHHPITWPELSAVILMIVGLSVMLLGGKQTIKIQN